MKQIFEAGALAIVPSTRGIVFTVLQKNEGENVIAFRQHNFDTGNTEAITKSAYLEDLYRNHYDFLKDEIEDYINIKALNTDSMGLILISPDGFAKVFDRHHDFKWKGSLKYKGFAPADAVIYNQSLWCSYPDLNALIRYNVNSMRQEFKIGSGLSGELVEPYSLFAIDDTLMITSSAYPTIQALNLEDYSLKTVYEVGENVQKYIKVDSNEIILTKSGIFRL